MTTKAAFSSALAAALTALALSVPGSALAATQARAANPEHATARAIVGLPTGMGGNRPG